LCNIQLLSLQSGARRVHGMADGPLGYCYLLMMLLQVIHIFEEMACGAYKLMGNGLRKYLVVASLLVTANFVVFALILGGQRVAMVLGLVTSGIMAVGNGVVHTVGYWKTRSLRDGVGAGVFSSLPLGVVGVVVFYLLAGALLAGG
jgi:hypothetical protein